MNLLYKVFFSFSVLWASWRPLCTAIQWCWSLYDSRNMMGAKIILVVFNKCGLRGARLGCSAAIDHTPLTNRSKGSREAVNVKGGSSYSRGHSVSDHFKLGEKECFLNLKLGVWSFFRHYILQLLYMDITSQYNYFWIMSTKRLTIVVMYYPLTW